MPICLYKWVAKPFITSSDSRCVLELTQETLASEKIQEFSVVALVEVEVIGRTSPKDTAGDITDGLMARLTWGW